MERHALTFSVRPGTEEQARRVLGSYPRPRTDLDDGGRLLATSVFLWHNHVVRVMDVDGPLSAVMRHLAADPAIRTTEEKLNRLLPRPRDLGDPGAMREFFARAMMTRVVHRGAGGEPAPGTRTRVALRYPVRPGHGAALARILAWGQSLPPGADSAPIGTTVFRHGDLVIRLLDLPSRAEEAIARLGPALLGVPTGRMLNDLLAPEWDLSTPAGLARLLTEQRLSAVTHRNAEDVAS